MDSEDIVRKFHQKRGRIRDPRSGKNPSRITDPGGKKAPDPGSGSATLPVGYPAQPVSGEYRYHYESKAGGGRDAARTRYRYLPIYYRYRYQY
jgi:hypothetical protein